MRWAVYCSASRQIACVLLIRSLMERTTPYIDFITNFVKINCIFCSDLFKEYLRVLKNWFCQRLSLCEFIYFV